MQTNDHIIRDYSAELDRKYGAVGTKEREQFQEEAWNYTLNYEPPQWK